MVIHFERKGEQFAADLSKPIDLSLRLRDGFDNPNCFWAPPVELSPVRADGFVGSTAEGGVVNFFNVRLNPHGNGTHTECVGHISKERYILGDCLEKSHFFAKLVSVYPTRMDDGDRVITLKTLQTAILPGEAEALILRTLPNDPEKQVRNYSGTNPPYLAADALQYLVACGIEHLLVDLPSVDREEDGGQLAGHKAFWQYQGPETRLGATITELIYVPNDVRDGDYWLNIQTIDLDLDVSPSRPIIFTLL